MTRYVIFDLDGTLVDSCAVCIDILSEMRAERGCTQPIDPLHARAYMSRGGQEMVAALLGDMCEDAESDLADFRARYQQRRTPTDTLFAGVAEGLAQLRAAGLTLAICSNKPQSLCEKVLEDTGLMEYFAVVIGGGEGRKPKPAPDLLDAVLGKLECTAQDCAFVGDSELDHAVAADARMPFHFLTHGYAAPGWEAQHCSIYDEFAPLTAAILARAPLVDA